MIFKWTRPAWCRHNPRWYPGFHICADLSVADPIIEGVNHFPKKLGGPGWNKGRAMSEENKAKIAEAQRIRWAGIRERNVIIYEQHRRGDSFGILSKRHDMHIRSIEKICQKQAALENASK